MTPTTLRDVVPVMNDMVRLELALASFYEACGEQFPDDRDFWAAIQSQERTHAEAIAHLGEIVSAHPEEFKCGRAFNSAAIRTILASIENYTAQARSGQLQPQRALFIAKDIENSLLEAHYTDIVSTGNVEFKKTIARIDEETRAHKDLFTLKLTKGGA